MIKLAVVFPGQGSQSVGMLDAWGDAPEVKKTLDQAHAALGEDLATLIHQGSKEALSLTTNTQPVMLVAGIAAWRMWQSAQAAHGLQHLQPVVMAGHSLGEYTAWVAAGALDFEQAIPLVRRRAEAMQEAVPVGQGAMAAILGLQGERVQQGCQQATFAMQDPNEVVEAVNFNDPMQTVIAGSKAAVAKACEILKGLGAKRALSLPVSAPFHSSLMHPAAQQLAQHLTQITLCSPQYAVINNVDVAIQTEPSAIADALVRQADHPVRWVETIHQFHQMGVTHVLECGPGNVLTGMIKRIHSDLTVLPVYDPATLTKAIEILTS